MSGLITKPTLWQQAAACAAYGGVSISITLFNKAVFSIYGFKYPNLVMLGQMLVTLFLIKAASRYEMVEVSRISKSGLKRVRPKRASAVRGLPNSSLLTKTHTHEYSLSLSHTLSLSVSRAKLFPLTVAWWVYVLSGVTALRFLTVPMFGLLRRATTLAVVVGEYHMFGKVVSKEAAGSIMVMLMGGLVGVSNDLSYNFWGYFYISVCCVSTALYLLLIRKLRFELRVSDTTLLYYNNLLSLPVMLAYLCLCTTEFQDAWSYPRLRDVKFQLFYLLSVSQGFLLNLCIFRCTTINSPLTTNITGIVKEIITTGLGLILFKDYVWNAKNVAGVLIGLLGGISYSVAGFRERTRKKVAN